VACRGATTIWPSTMQVVTFAVVQLANINTNSNSRYIRNETLTQALCHVEKVEVDRCIKLGKMARDEIVETGL